MSAVPARAYLWGEDAYGVERAAREYAEQLAESGAPMETWRVNAAEEPVDGADEAASGARRRERALDDIEEHLGMLPLFGGGTLVVVRQPASLLAAAAPRERLIRLTRSVPEGNALCFTDLIATGAKGPAAKGELRDAVAELGGLVRELRVPGPGQMERWLMERARELDITLEPAAARLLAERVGTHVREADVDRRRRTELAAGELEKLALYRPGGTIERADVEALVAESIPGSTWAFLDAVGSRALERASGLAERLVSDGTPLPVLVAQLHRRLRELILVRDHLDAGVRPPQMMKEMRLQSFRAKKLTEQARTWSADELDAALAGLLELDLRGKGIALDGSTPQMSERISALALQAWLVTGVGRDRGASVR